MNIGDRVRLLHGKEEGVIKRFLKNNMVDVEIEDGFSLPVMVTEIVPISKSEGQYFKSSSVKTEEVIIPSRKVKSASGLFLGFSQVNDRTVVLYVINNTDYDFSFVLTQAESRPAESRPGSDKTHRGLVAGLLKPGTHLKSDVELKMQDFDEWGSFNFHAFYFMAGYFPEKAPLNKKLRMRANSFFNTKKVAPVLEKEMFLFQLDGEPEAAKVEKISAEQIRNSMLSNNEKFVAEPAKFSKPSKAVDLHIEQLTTDFMAMNNSQIVEMQMRTFESNLELAIASGMDEITFIHGVGAGVLRNEIHKRLSKHKNVAWFQDAQKDKFGYGATRVKIK